MNRAASILLLIASALPAPLLTAQQISAGTGVGVGGDAWRADIHGQLAIPLGNRLHVAAGLRLTHYGGSTRELRRQGPVDDALPASLTIDPNIWGLNLMVAGEVRVLGPISAGANLDLFGVAGGPARSHDTIEIHPAPFSMFRYGNADRGSLNSEFFLVARMSERFGLRAGLSHYVVGYDAEQGGAMQRYLRFDDAIFLAVRWRPGAP